MSTIIECIKINPFTKTVSVVNLDRDSLQAFYDEITNEFVTCELIEIVQVNSLLTLVVDEEGLQKRNKSFKISGFIFPIAGIALVISIKGENFHDSRLSVSEVWQMVQWEE